MEPQIRPDREKPSEESIWIAEPPYIMQLSIIGERRTVQMLDRVGLESRVVDFGFFEFNAVFDAKREQIARVEEHSDAYHLKLANSDTMVAYLIEVRRKGMKANP